MSYTTATAAKALGVSISRIDKLCAYGQLNYTMHGRDRLISQEAIDAYKKQRDERPKGGRPCTVKRGVEGAPAECH